MRRKGILVTVEMDSMGNVTVQPVVERYAQAFQAVVKANGGPNEASAFIQEHNVNELRDDISADAWRALQGGYTVNCIMDPWTLGHYYGYDAHTVAENGMNTKGMNL